MKKLMFAALMMLGTSAAFAGDSEALKAVLAAKDFNQASQLLKQNLGSMANAQEKAKAYDYVTKLALKTFDAQNATEAQTVQAKMLKQKTPPYDTIAFYQSAYDATVNGLECVKYDAQPNEKGKVKPKFTDALTPSLTNARMQLVNAGNYYAQRNDQDNVLKYWGTFLDTDDNPLFAKAKEGEKQYLGQVAYYTALYANQAKLYDKAEKYADIAMQDTAMRKQAETFKYSMAQMNLKSNADSVAFAKKMQASYEADPNNETVLGILCNMYSGLNMTSELNALLDKAIATDPNNFTAWAMKGQMLVNKLSKEQNPNWDECINDFKKAVAIKNDNSVVLTYLGFAINAKASAINGNVVEQKQLYTESMGFLEQAKTIDPNRAQSNWAYPLYQCYYTLYGADDSRTKELEGMLKK
uniref:hypothetical protein n=1 Tax=Prevotella sp. TaxID=59823 RepID=UPI003FF06498